MSLLNQPSHCWRNILSCYKDVLSAKAKKQKKEIYLVELDHWYQKELPMVIRSRSEKYITRDELNKIMKWKLTRGKFRPRLQQMIEENDAQLVEAVSCKAFRALPDLDEAVQSLECLKAVGPATASAVLAAGSPEFVPFMADESMMALPGLQPLKYTTQTFRTYVNEINSLVKELQKQDAEFGWTPHKVELTLWTYQSAKDLHMDGVLKCLEGVTNNTPSSSSALGKRSSRANKNIATKKKC